MPEPAFTRLRHRLLQSGIAPRRVRRLVQELRVHYAELLAEQRRAGLEGPRASRAALERLGTEESLVQQMLTRPQLHTWSRRWPWAIYAVAPLLLFPILFAVTASVMVGVAKASHGLRQVSPAHFMDLMRAIRLFALYVLPALVATWMAVMAARRGVAQAWALLSIALLALWGSTTNIDLSAHQMMAGAGLSLRPAALVRELTRWVPTALAAVAMAAVATQVHRLRERQQQARTGDEVNDGA